MLVDIVGIDIGFLRPCDIADWAMVVKAEQCKQIALRMAS